MKKIRTRKERDKWFEEHEEERLLGLLDELKLGLQYLFERRKLRQHMHLSEQLEKGIDDHDILKNIEQIFGDLNLKKDDKKTTKNNNKK